MAARDYLRREAREAFVVESMRCDASWGDLFLFIYHDHDQDPDLIKHVLDTKQWRHHEDIDEKQASGRGLGWKHCIYDRQIKADVEYEVERFRAGCLLWFHIWYVRWSSTSSGWTLRNIEHGISSAAVLESLSLGIGLVLLTTVIWLPFLLANLHHY